jgi:hypothetical protein
MILKIGTIRMIGVLLVAVGVISWVVWIIVTWLFAGPFSIGVFEFDYSRCRFDQSAGCQVVAKAPFYGLILIAIGALLYRSARTKKAGVVGKEASSKVPPS